MSDTRITLESTIQTAIDSALKEVHTCLPAVITAINGDQTIDAQPTIQRKIKNELVNLPLLVGVPLRYLKSAGYSISFPMSVGDHVLVIFAERSIDTWLLSGAIRSPADIRRHSLSDAFAIPMMYDQTDIIQDFDNVNLVLKSAGGASVKLTPGGNIELNGNTDSLIAFNDMRNAFNLLKTELNALIIIMNLNVIAYNTHTHGSVVPPPMNQQTPGIPAVADMSAAELPTVKVP